MAKRKRLTPAQADYLTPPRPEAGPHLPEIKALSPGSLAPIAQVAGEASAAAALAEVAGTLAAARAEGRLVQRLPLTAVEADHLVRDRLATDEEELALLMGSLAEHGQRSPIDVTELAPGRFGLISGWRRLTALARLHAQTGEDRFATVLALVRRPETAAAAYVAMVEENEVRLGLSYYERARIAAKAVDLGVFESERVALQQLFAAASRPRRSKIGSFLSIYRALDPVLRFPAAIPERLGLALARLVETDPDRLAVLRAALAARPAPYPVDELALLQSVVDGTAREAASDPDDAVPDGTASPARHRASARPGGRSGGAAGEEIAPGITLRISGPAARPVFQLSGSSLGPDFGRRLRDWLAGG